MWITWYSACTLNNIHQYRRVSSVNTDVWRMSCISSVQIMICCISSITRKLQNNTFLYFTWRHILEWSRCPNRPIRPNRILMELLQDYSVQLTWERMWEKKYTNLPLKVIWWSEDTLLCWVFSYRLVSFHKRQPVLFLLFFSLEIKYVRNARGK